MNSKCISCSVDEKLAVGDVFTAPGKIYRDADNYVLDERRSTLKARRISMVSCIITAGWEQNNGNMPLARV